MKRFSVVIISVIVIFCAVNAQASSIWGVSVGDTSNAIINLDPFTGAVATSYTAPNFSAGNTNIGLAGWSNELFYTNADAQNGTIYRMNPSDGSTIGSYSVSGGYGIDGLGYWSGTAGDYIYTSGCSVGDVHRYLSANGSSPSFYWSDIASPLAMAGDNGGKIYSVGNGVTGQFGIWELDALSDLAATWFAAAPSDSIVGMAFDGMYLYLSDQSNRLFTMNSSGALVNTLTMDYSLFALGSTEGTPNVVPEPSSFLLLGAGLAGLAAWRRRKQS